MDSKKPTINLSLFSTLTESFSIKKPIKSPRSFENGVVGLSIVATMNELDTIKAQESVQVSNFTLSSPKSSPIPIVSSAKVAMNFRGYGGSRIMNIDREIGGCDVVNESDESYTCVISHVGNNAITKHVYYGDQVGGFCDDDVVRVVDINPGLFYASSSPIIMTITDGCLERNGFWTQDFLSSCYLCNKMLHGLDIFMYRGEKAFCSTDCRDKQIRSENYKEKCGSEARKQQHECSVSPCSSPQVCFARVAAA